MCCSRSVSGRRRHALLGAVVSGVVSLVVATSGVTGAGATAASPVRYESSQIPSDPVGAQLRWLLGAARNQPIPVRAIEAHFSRAFLADITPAELNAALDEGADASRARFDGVISTAPGALEAAIRLGARGPRLVISMAVDDSGLISELNFGVIPLRSRSSVHLSPVSLPLPTGGAALGTETIVVNDRARGGREIPVQLWYPTRAESDTAGTDAPYARAATAELLAQQLAVPARDLRAVTTHATESSVVETAGVRLPVVLVSPGSGITRTLYSGLSAELASHGNLVAVLDHPGDGDLVEYPDGHTTPAQDASDEVKLAARVADARVVLDRLLALDDDVMSPLHGALDFGDVAFVGHSFGGATAAEAMRVDDRFHAGVNLDGTLSGDVVQTGLDRPFLFVSSDRPEDETWTTFRRASTGTQSLVLRGTGHLTFTDWPSLSRLRPDNEARDSFGIGDIDRGRAVTLQAAYVLAFLDVHPGGETPALLSGASPQYPEAEFR